MRNSTVIAIGFAAFCAAAAWLLVIDEAQSAELPQRPAIHKPAQPIKR